MNFKELHTRSASSLPLPLPLPRPASSPSTVSLSLSLSLGARTTSSVPSAPPPLLSPWWPPWCPAAGCDYAIDFIVGCGSYDVTCRCSYSFCWKCTVEAHRPVDCGTVAKWILKNSAESENMNWLCLGAWSEHGERTGGFYACNRYETAKQEGVYDEAEKRREMAKNSLEWNKL